jgi:hypothetical protein
VDERVLIEKHQGNNSFLYQLSPDAKFKEDSHIADKDKLIKFLNEKDTKILELTSTIYFLEREGWDEKPSIERKLESLKPDLKKYIKDSFTLKKEIENICAEASFQKN